MITRRLMNVSAFLLPAVLLLSALSARATLIHSFVAEDDSSGPNTTSTWHDLTGSNDWSFPTSGDMSITPVTGSNTTFAETYTATGSDAGAYANPMIANSDATGSASIWFRQDVPSTGDDFEKTLFEDGGGPNGFTMLFRRNSNSLSLRVAGSSMSGEVSVPLDSFDLSDFVQATVTFDGSDATLYAYSANDFSSLSNTTPNVVSGNLGGGNGAGLFNGGNDKGTVGGSNDSGVNAAVFDGDIAAVFVHDDTLTAGEVESQFNSQTIPEPGSLTLVSMFAFGVGLVLRRR